MAKYYYISWSEDDDALLIEIMQSKIERGTTLEKLFDEASERLNRTLASVKNRWYKLCAKNVVSAGRRNKNHS